MKSKFHLQREKLRISMPLLLTYTDRAVKFFPLVEPYGIYATYHHKLKLC